jgi:hypothetical protein
MTFVPHPVSVFGTLGVLVVGWIVFGLGRKFIDTHAPILKSNTGGSAC